MIDADFVEFPKISRWSRDIIVTEKIDGTNGQVHVLEDGTVRAASRNRHIAPGDDGFGFAAWVKANEEELRTVLGVGRHYGEWWGSGIQRRYGLDHKRFSLFNTSRWTEATKPACCHVVPVLFEGTNLECEILGALYRLEQGGSVAAPGFPKPEGVIIFHTASNSMFKKTIEKDSEPKSKTEAA